MKTEELIRYYKANIEAIEKGLNNDSLSADKKFRLGEKHCQQWQCFCVFPPAFSGKTAPVAVKTDKDQDQVPGQSVNGQCHVRLHQSGWFCQCHDASHKGKILEIGADGAGDRTAFMHKN